MNTVRKIKIIINNGDDEIRKSQYQFIRNAMYAQYQGLNRCMGYLMSGYYANNMDIKSQGFKDHQKTITNSLYIFNDIEFGKGIDSKSSITQKVKKDFSTALKNGLAKGERTVTNYKKSFPLMTRGRDLKFSYGDNDEILINWVNKIQFKAITGNSKNSIELEHTLHKIINGDYKVGQSSLTFNKKNELILILTIAIPEIKGDEYKPVANRTLGVDLGLAFPVYMALNDITYIRKSLGSYNEFAKQKLQYKARRERLYKQLDSVKGGKGRKDKLKALDQFKEKEKNFAKTYNHFLSKKIVLFAIKNQCEYINLEKIDSSGLENRVLGLWTYYDLQKDIEYKAKLAGIKVRYVKAAFTSQKCSRCGYIEKENRQEQSKFVCKECGLDINADYNASINIAQSTEFIK